jgi:hypothetical protein
MVLSKVANVSFAAIFFVFEIYFNRKLKNNSRDGRYNPRLPQMLFQVVSKALYWTFVDFLKDSK